MRELSVQFYFAWLPKNWAETPLELGPCGTYPISAVLPGNSFFRAFGEKLMSALILTGGAKPATHYLHSHKLKCSTAFSVSLGLEPVPFSILPPASAANSPLLFKRSQCYKSSIWLSAGPSHDLVLNRFGHEKY